MNPWKTSVKPVRIIITACAVFGLLAVIFSGCPTGLLSEIMEDIEIEKAVQRQAKEITGFSFSFDDLEVQGVIDEGKNPFR